MKTYPITLYHPFCDYLDAELPSLNLDQLGEKAPSLGLSIVVVGSVCHEPYRPSDGVTPATDETFDAHIEAINLVSDEGLVCDLQTHVTKAEREGYLKAMEDIVRSNLA